MLLPSSSSSACESMLMLSMCVRIGPIRGSLGDEGDGDVVVVVAAENAREGGGRCCCCPGRRWEIRMMIKSVFLVSGSVVAAAKSGEGQARTERECFQ